MRRRYRGDTAAVVGIGILAVLAWVGMLVVFLVIGHAMFKAADRGDTAKTIAFGVVLLVLVLTGRSSK